MTLPDLARRLTVHLTAAARTVFQTVRGWLARATTAIQQAAVRHRDRVADDPAYSRTVSTAVSELAVTLLPHPNVAAAVAILLTTALSPDPSGTPRGRPSPVFDEDPYDPYPAPRRSSTTPPGSLWDRLGT